MRAIMLAFACRQQYSALRTAAAAGHTVHVLGRDCARGLKYSRYCATFHNFNFDPESQPLDEALAEINYWVKNLSADLILPSDVISTRLLAALAGRLPVPSCALPSPEGFDMMNDKWQFYQFCKKIGARVPQTWLFSDISQLSAAVLGGTIPLPLIVKPHDAMGSTGIYRILDKSDLKLLDTAQYKPLLAQKLIIGDEIDISVLSNKGRIAAYAIQRNLPEKYAFIRHDPLLAQASHVLEASQFHGITHFDAIVEKATGESYLIECNPRFWLSMFATTVAGMNFIKMSLDVESLNLDKPLCLVDKEVLADKSTLRLIKQLITTFSISEIDYNLLKYSLVDLIGKRWSLRPLFDDSVLPSTSVGSIGHQIAALAAIRKLST